jgi:hypothetical protein
LANVNDKFKLSVLAPASLPTHTPHQQNRTLDHDLIVVYGLLLSAPYAWHTASVSVVSEELAPGVTMRPHKGAEGQTL